MGLRNVELTLVITVHSESFETRSFLEPIHASVSPYAYETIIVAGHERPGDKSSTADLDEHYSPTPTTSEAIKRASSIASAFHQATGDVLAIVEADPRYRPGMIPELLETIRAGADIVIASRRPQGRGSGSRAAVRRLLSTTARNLASMALPNTEGVTDLHSGFFLVRRELLENSPLDAVGHTPLLDILAIVRPASVAEVPYDPRDGAPSGSGRGRRRKRDFVHLLTLIWASGEVKRLLKYGAVGLSGMGVHLGILTLLTELAGVFYIVSAAISYETSILTNFTFNESWTFRDRRRSTGTSIASRLVKFNLVSLAGLALHEAILWFMTEVVGLFYILSAVCAILIVFIWNFTLNVRWTWKARTRRRAEVSSQ